MRGGVVYCWPLPPGAGAQSSVRCLWLVSDPKDLACWIPILGEDSSAQSEKHLFVCCVYIMHKKFLYKRINIQGGPKVGILYTVYLLSAHPVYNIMMNLP